MTKVTDFVYRRRRVNMVEGAFKIRSNGYWTSGTVQPFFKSIRHRI